MIEYDCKIPLAGFVCVTVYAPPNTSREKLFELAMNELKELDPEEIRALTEFQYYFSLGSGNVSEVELEEFEYEAYDE